ncbi:MAG TPA: hypothetical protein IGS53_02035 [Leptolyngbyaceae cyanobacterium M33_DOE_097]|uniref:Uncharacterized protein n=1 Tax=Oscillatoriales cyanobacterium SpSt-418 TaxID=2282169 RepID=A0A7C3PIH0_9CYAN|nr:hypothetical protein [Leptolyngbyaceae cyanobacterium M33_DOE_097]
MPVQSVTHLLETGEIMVMGHVEDVLTVTGQRVSRVDAVAGQEQPNPSAIHVNFEILKKGEHPVTPKILVLALSPSDVLELGILLVATAIEDKTSTEVSETKEHLSQRVVDLQQTMPFVIGYNRELNNDPKEWLDN